MNNKDISNKILLSYKQKIYNVYLSEHNENGTNICRDSFKIPGEFQSNSLGFLGNKTFLAFKPIHKISSQRFLCKETANCKKFFFFYKFLIRK